MVVAKQKKANHENARIAAVAGNSPDIAAVAAIFAARAVREASAAKAGAPPLTVAKAASRPPAAPGNRHRKDRTRPLPHRQPLRVMRTGPGMKKNRVSSSGAHGVDAGAAGGDRGVRVRDRLAMHPGQNLPVQRRPAVNQNNRLQIAIYPIVRPRRTNPHRHRTSSRSTYRTYRQEPAQLRRSKPSSKNPW